MQHNIYTLEKEMLREIERRNRAASAQAAAAEAAKTAPAFGQWEVLVVTRTLVRIGPLVLAWDRP